MAEDRRAPRHKGDRSLFDKTINRESVVRCYYCSIALAIIVSIVLIFVNTIL